MIRVVISCEFEATHNWPGVTEVKGLSDVNFLQFEHRHIFHIKAIKSVIHDDRDVEIIMLKRSILKYLQDNYPDRKLRSTSCEMLAIELSEQFDLYSCEVLEDGENGAIYVRD